MEKRNEFNPTPEQEKAAEEFCRKTDEKLERLVELFKEFREMSWGDDMSSERRSLCQTICYCLYRMIERIGLLSDAYKELFSQGFDHSMSLTN